MAYRPSWDLFFTLDKRGTKVRDDAISVEDCTKHDCCKRFGIHIFRVESTSKVKESDIPYYGSTWRPQKEDKGRQFRENGFVKNQWRKHHKALSTFVHYSKRHNEAERNRSIEGPLVCHVEIENNYMYGEFNSEKREILWRCSIGDNLLNQLLETNAPRYLLSYPNSWRDAILVESVLKIYHEIIAKYIKDKTKDGIFFITSQEDRKQERVESPLVTVFVDEFDKAKRLQCATEDDSAFKFISRALEYLKPPGHDSYHFPRRYQSDVESLLQANSVVKCTKPLRDFKQFLNQQILIHSLTNDKPLYSRDDLLGLLVPRFRKPVMTKAICKRFSEEKLAIFLDYATEQHLDSSLGILKLSEFNGKENARAQRKEAKIYYTGLFCADENYCNRNLVHFNYADYEKLVVTWKAQSGENLTGILQELDQEKTEETSPYQCKVENSERTGTVLTLKRGAELQMQISTCDVKDNGTSLGLRMLRIGQDCHLCFTHINYPGKAFMSDRNDVRRLITNVRVIALQKATTEDILAASEYVSVKLVWSGDYMGGGSFNLDDGRSTKKGDLLCIRQEIPDGENPKYIWCCHAIVYKVDSNIVNFLTCTLSQGDEPSNDKEFCITIIHPKDVESKVDALKRVQAK